MRASLTVGGIEVELSTPVGGALEAILAGRFASFLGAVQAPICSLALEPSESFEGPPAPAATLLERVGETTFSVAHPRLFGLFELAGAGSVHVAANPYDLGNCLRLLFGLLAPRHEALMLHGTSVITGDGAHFFTGLDTSAVPGLVDGGPLRSDGIVMVRRERDGWRAASTPFWAPYERLGQPLEAQLRRLWSILPAQAEVAADTDSVAASLIVAEHAYLPTAESEFCQATFHLVGDLAGSVPFTGLHFAEGLGAWTEVDPH